MDGIINIYKEKGYTSHDVCAKLRGILKTKKIGHTGTLDPDAQGVLPVCVGKATRLADMMKDHDKSYAAVILFGVETDTQDISGRVIRRADVDFDEETAKKAILAARQMKSQIPPMFSALKRDGKKLCDLARAGKNLELEPRPIKVYDVTVTDVSLPRAAFEISVGRGTYIRTICQDIGRSLSSAACMESLVRTRVGQFDISESRKLSEIEALFCAGREDEFLCPLEEFFKDLPALRPKTGTRLERLLINGNPFCAQDMEEDSCSASGERLRAYSAAGEFLGVYGYCGEKEKYMPEKMFTGG